MFTPKLYAPVQHRSHPWHMRLWCVTSLLHYIQMLAEGLYSSVSLSGSNSQDTGV
jgi:hypothetical protein